MRRLIAFIVDFLIGISLSLSIVFGVEEVFNRSIDNQYITLITCALLISLFEYANAGQTPGRLLTGIRLVNANSPPLTIHRLFLRNSILFLFAHITSLAIDFIFPWLFNLNTIAGIDGIGSGWLVFFVAFSFPYISTLGNQSLHDYLTGTAVVKTSGRESIKTTSYRLIWFATIVSVLLITALRATFTTQNDNLVEKLRRSEPNKNFEAHMRNEELPNLVPTPEELGARIFGFDKYHRGGTLFLVGFTQYSKLISDEKLPDHPILSIAQESNIIIPKYAILLNAQGMTNPSVHERIAYTACEKANSFELFPICQVTLAYTINIMGPLYITIRRKLLVLRIESDKDNGKALYYPVSPDSRLSATFGIGTPSELAMQQLTDQNPATRQSIYQ